MMENDDRLVAQFFEEHKVEIEDNGFSRGVMDKLPDGARRASRIWTLVCTVMGISMFFLLDCFDSLRMILGNIFGDFIGLISSIHLPGLTPLTLYLAILTIMAVSLHNLIVAER